MKKLLCALVFVSLTASVQAEESWWQSLLNTVGLGDSEQSQEAEQNGVDMNGLIDSLTSNLGVTKEQAQGGMAALFNYAKQNVSQEQFTAISEQIPGLDAVMRYLPAVSAVKEQGLGGLMDMAAGASEELGQINDLKKQFDSLGLDMSMVSGFAEQASTYFDTPETEAAKNLLGDSLSQFL